MNDATMKTVPATLPFEDLERAYEALALAIDAAGPEREALFLTRLALVLAHRGGDLQVFEAALATALEDVALGTSPACAQPGPGSSSHG